MSKSIDERIVEMKFDNADFEKNVQQSMKTLDQLDKSLDLSNSTRGLDNLQKAADSFDLSGMNTACGKVGESFNALQVIATGALLEIGSQAVRTGEQLVKNLVVDQVSAGWEKYAEKTTAVQTIMAATADQFQDTGEQMEYVEEQLEKLNWFTDETSYNFTDMTNNIGKFTSAGVDLETSVSAMQGIATATAIAGQNASAASRVMYNFSQALGAGAVKLQDWMSIENANIATKEFKETIIETAKEMGNLDKQGKILKKTADKYSGDNFVDFQNFRNTLAAGWLDSDVLIKSLEKYGNFAMKLNDFYEELDGEVLTSQLIRYVQEYKDGTLDLDKAMKETGMNADTLKARLEDLGSKENELGFKAFKAAQEAKTFAEAMDATKDAVSTIWMNIFEDLFGNYEEAKVLWTDLAEFLYDVFAQPMQNLEDLLDEWAELGGRDDIIAIFANFEEAIESLLEIVSDAWEEIFPKDAAVEGMKNFTKAFADFTEKLIPNEKVTDRLSRTFKGLFAILDIGKKILNSLWNSIKPLFGVTGSFLEAILDLTAGIGDFFVELDSGMGVANTFSEIMDVIHNSLQFLVDDLPTINELFSRIVANYTSVGGGLAGIFKVIRVEVASLIKCVFDLAESIFGLDLSPFEEGFLKAFRSVTLRIEEFIRNNIPTLQGFLDFMHNTFEEAGGGFKGVFTTILRLREEIANGLLEFIGALTNIDMSKAEQIVSDAVDNILNSFKKFGDDDGVKEFKSEFDGIKKTFQDTWDVLKKVGNKIGDVFKYVFDNIKAALDEDFMGTLERVVGNGAFVALAGGINKLAQAISKIAKKVEKAKKEMGEGKGSSFSDILKEVKGALVEFQKSIKAGAILKTAVAIGILAASLTAIATIPTEDLGWATAAISALVGEMAGLTLLFSKLKFGDTFNFMNISSMSLMMISFATAISLLASAIKKIGDLPADRIGMATLAISALIFEMYAVSEKFSKMGSEKGLTALCFSLIIFAEAVKILAKPIKTIGEMEVEDAIQGVVAISALLWEFVGIAKIMEKSGSESGLLKLAVSLGIMAYAVKMLVKPIRDIGMLDLEDCVQGIIAISVMLWELVAVAKIFNDIGIGSGAMKAGAAITIMAVGLRIVADAIYKLEDCEPENLIASVVALTVGLVALSAALTAMATLIPKDKMAGLMSVGVAMVLMSESLSILAKAMTKLQDLSVEQLAKSLISLGLGLVVMTGALLILGTNKSMNPAKLLAASAALLIVAESCKVLAKAFSMMKDISWQQLLASSLSMVGVLGALSLIAYALGNVGPIVLIGAAAIVILAEACKLMADGFVKVTEGLVNIVEALKGFAETLVMLSQMSDEQIEQLISNLHRLVDESPELMTQAIAAICAAIIVNSENIAKTIWTLLLDLSNMVLEYKPIIIGNVIDAMIETMQAILDRLPEFLSLGTQLIVAFLDGMAQSQLEISLAAAELIAVFIEGIGAQNLIIAEAAMETIITFVDGLAATMEEKTPDAEAAVERLFTAMKDMALAIIGGEDTIEKFKNAGMDLIRGFINGIKDLSLQHLLVETVSDLGAKALKGLKNALKEKSPSRATDQMGEYFDLGLINGIRRLTGDVRNSAEEVGDEAVNSLSNALSYIPDVEDITDEMVITPVLDLTNVRNGANELNNLLESDRMINASAGFNQATYSRQQASEIQNGLMMDRLLSLQSALDRMGENSNSEVPINVNVSLEGDADGIFRVVQDEHDKFTKQNGRSAFAY